MSCIIKRSPWLHTVGEDGRKQGNQVGGRCRDLVRDDSVWTREVAVPTNIISEEVSYIEVSYRKVHISQIDNLINVHKLNRPEAPS